MRKIQSVQMNFYKVWFLCLHKALQVVLL
jgi:hypothetical protein